jgi:hypothetical protein
MNRITIERVQRAYEKTGRQPARGMWGHSETGGCCGLGAVLHAEHPGALTKLPTPSASAMACEFLGLSTAYICGFTDGFDSRHLETHTQHLKESNEEYRAGYDDGQAAARVVFGE